jgi:hypothetical protein
VPRRLHRHLLYARPRAAALNSAGFGTRGPRPAADVELANSDRLPDLRQVGSSSPEATLRRLQAIMACRERLTLNVAPLLAVEEMTLSLAEG